MFQRAYQPQSYPEQASWPVELPASGRASARSRRGKVAIWLDENALFLAGIAAIGAISLALIPSYLNQDGWLALFAGRYVAAHGIPQHDTLTVLTHGVRWIDQQWLAQLAVYELDRIGGLALYCIVYVGLALTGLGLAIAAGRALGGSERHVLWVLPLSGFVYFASALQIRTQGFAYPLFAATVWLLARDARHPGDRRVYLVFPLLILWANLHGSVTLGVGIAMIYGATLLLEDMRTGGWRRPWRGIRGRTVAFLLASPACLFATPYGLAAVSYYHSTLLNSTFSKVVTEWQPVTSIMVLAIPFFVIVFATGWLLGRSGARTLPFDQLTLLVLAVGAIFAVRNVGWFGLGTVMLVPAVIGRVARRPRTVERRRTLNLAVAGASLLVLASATVAVALRPASWFERHYDPQAVKTVAAVLARQPGTKVFADIRYADWLMWHDPALEGHIAYDTRLELLTNRQILALSTLTRLPTPHQPDLLGGYGLLVLDPTNKPNATILLARPGTHVIFRGKRVVIASSSGA